MTISRREMFAIGAVAATVSAGAVSACSPSDFSDYDLPGKFFATVAAGKLVEASKWLDEDSSLVLISTEGSQRFEGAFEIREAIHRLLAVEGFNMIGDMKNARAGGMYWAPMGPWLCSDMIKGEVVELGLCGDGLSSSVFNVLVDARLAEDKIRTILLLENRNLVVQMGNWSEVRMFGK